MAFANRTVDGWRPFHSTPEDIYGAVAQYYDLQWVSFRTATYRLARFLNIPGFTYPELMMPQDGLHIADPGCRVIADVLAHLWQQTVVELLLRPWGPVDEHMLKEPLPEPMVPG